MKFLDLFVVALMHVLKVLLIMGVGLFLATDRIDLLGATARQNLNNLVFYVFSLSLIGSSLDDTITLKSFATLWFMPINIFLAFSIAEKISPEGEGRAGVGEKAHGWASGGGGRWWMAKE